VIDGHFPSPPGQRNISTPPRTLPIQLTISGGIGPRALNTGKPPRQEDAP